MKETSKSLRLYIREGMPEAESVPVKYGLKFPPELWAEGHVLVGPIGKAR